tara:strand:- start:145 stop:2355 length:2211 start_codon:yes stop_codon:yes gene_type:complete
MVPQNVSDSFIESLSYASEYEVQFKLTRRLGSGTETEIEFNKLTYHFITPPQVFEFKSTTPNVRLSTNTITYEHSTQQKITANDPSTAGTILAEDPLQRYFFGYVKKDTGTNEFYGEDIGNKLKSLTFLEISQDGFTVNQISETATVKYNPFNDPTKDFTFTRTYSTFAPNSFKATEVSKAKHTCIDKFGLKTNLTIDYSEISMKYSDSFTVATDPDAPVYAHHIGDENGAYTLTPSDAVFPETQDSDRIGHNNFVKVSHNWMSLDEIGANIHGFNNLDITGSTSVATRGGAWLSKLPEVRVGGLFYEDVSTFYSEPPGFKRIIQDNTGIRTDLKMSFISGISGLPVINDLIGIDAPGEGRNIGIPTGETTILSGTAGFLGTIQNVAPAIINGKLFTSHHMSGQDAKSGYPVIMIDLNKAIKQADIRAVGQGARTRFAVSSPITDDVVVNFADLSKNIDFINGADEWFDEIPFKGQFGEISNDVKVTYDYSENSQNEILLVRSYNHPSTDTIYNEAVLITQNGAITDKFRVLKKFRETIVAPKTFDRYVHGVPSSYEYISPNTRISNSTDYNRWARRYFADNVSRIKVFNGHFILPTGSALMKRTDTFGTSLSNVYEFTTLEEILGVDIRRKAIDQYIVLPNNKLAYVSVTEGMIDDGLGNINIRLDSNQFNHIYLTNDALNPFDFYGIMTKIPYSYTTPTSSGGFSLDRVQNIIGDTPRVSYSRKMFMFKALGKL